MGPPEQSMLAGSSARILSAEDCHDILQRLARYASGGGYTATTIVSSWLGYVRWSRNRITLAGDLVTRHVQVVRDLHGGSSHWVLLNEMTDDALIAAARRAERLAKLEPERPLSDLITHYEPEPVQAPNLFSEATYQVDAAQRSAVVRSLIEGAERAGMLSAGYLEISAHSQAVLTSWGYHTYFPYTWAQLSMTVRDPKVVGSGWAGRDHHDWGQIDAPALAAVALDKCLKSRDPVAVEPGRYLTILEPQAVAQFVEAVFKGDLRDGLFDREATEGGRGRWPHPFNKSDGQSRLGERVIDSRLSLGADPLDPALGFPPQAPRNWWGGNTNNVGATVYHPVTWVQDGVLVNLAYDRDYALEQLRINASQKSEGALRMGVSGPTRSVDEMVATTKRGLLVTRFSDVEPKGSSSCLGWTRDGVWLIENGAVTKPVKNFLFEEDVLAALNRVEQVGIPQRVLMPHTFAGQYAWMNLPTPCIMPPLKLRDFNFVALSDAI